MGDRKSTSGAVGMLGKHYIQTWFASRGVFALSGAKAEFHAMTEGAARAKGFLSLGNGFNSWRRRNEAAKRRRQSAGCAG